MFKGLISEIALDVGNSSAMVLNQLYQWIKESDRTVVYRTNEEIKSDLCGLISTATIQRAKKKLVEKGYVTISFAKGYNRVTYFTFTEKALNLLSKTKEESVTKPSEKKHSEKPKKAPTKPFNPPVAHTEKMQELFAEQGTRKAPSPIPEHLLEVIKGIRKPKGGDKPYVKKLCDDKPLVEDSDIGLSDEDWKGVDEAQGVQSKTPSTLSMKELADMAFNPIPNLEVFESNRKQREHSLLYSEDY